MQVKMRQADRKVKIFTRIDQNSRININIKIKPIIF